ncbi:MAG: hypothetical protein JNN03_00845 [Rubrivivax sp.]|nr:hypothetical protein [Rubrivivax sp.]
MSVDEEGSEYGATLLDLLTNAPFDLPAVGQRFPVAEWEEVLDRTEFGRAAEMMSADEIDRLAVSEMCRRRLLSDRGDLVVETEVILRVNGSLGPSQERQLEHARDDVEREAERFNSLAALFAKTVRGLGREAHSTCETQILGALRLERFGVEDGEYRPRDGLEQLGTMRLLGHEPWDHVVPTVRHVVDGLSAGQKLALWFNWTEPEPDAIRSIVERFVESGEPVVGVRDLGELIDDLVGGANRAVSETADRLKQRSESGEIPED